jgi:isopropylmalate/homocitrate/citramalate synthase
VVAAGAGTVNLPDTVGYSTPDEHAALIGRMVKALGKTSS